MFKVPFSFEGRIRRLEFGLSYIICYIILMTAAFISQLDENLKFVIIILFIPLLWFLLAQRVKRSHDIGNSGWYILIPFYGLWLLFADSEFGKNEYGPNPKGIGNDEIDVDSHLI